MKKIIIFVIIINLFASVKDINSSRTIICYKKKFIDKVNYFIPNFLKISNETPFFNFNIYEDTLTQKIPSLSLKIHIKLPELYIKKTKLSSNNFNKKNNNVIHNKKISYLTTTTFKLRPILRIRKTRIFFLQNIIEVKRKYSNTEYGISNKINYYFNSFREEINFAYIKHLKHTYSTNFNISTTKESLPTKYYSFNISISNFKEKFISSYGYTFGGDTDKNPIIYYHNIFINFRKALHKKYIFLEITPYILISKYYNFKIKPAISSSVNIKF
jgi:hypothetical protein